MWGFFVAMGCTATQIALEKKDLKTETKMSASIFLDLESQLERTVYVDIKSTTDRDIDIIPLVRQYIQERGYTIVATPREAFYILQANILYVGVADPSALRAALGAGYGGPLWGAVAGATSGAVVSGTGAAIGAGIGGYSAVQRNWLLAPWSRM